MEREALQPNVVRNYHAYLDRGHSYLRWGLLLRGTEIVVLIRLLPSPPQVPDGCRRGVGGSIPSWTAVCLVVLESAG